MDVIFGLIPMVLLFGFLVVVVFIWMAKKGYFEDMDGQASRILMDDEDFEGDQTQSKSTAKTAAQQKVQQTEKMADDSESAKSK